MWRWKESLKALTFGCASCFMRIKLKPSLQKVSRHGKEREKSTTTTPPLGAAPPSLCFSGALSVPTPTYQVEFGTSQHGGLPERAGLRPENCQFSGLQDRVPRQQVLRTGDEGMQAENWGFLAWRTSSRPSSQADYLGPQAGVCAPFSFAQTGFGVSFPPPTLCL